MTGKRRKCDAYKVFEKNLERSRAFLRAFDGHRKGSGQPSNDHKELLRGAIVFAIGSLDAFLHELILEIVPRFGGDPGAMRDALGRIAKDDPSLALRVSLANDDASRAAEFRSALDDWLERKSFQGPEHVAIALQYVGSTLTLQELNPTAAADLARYTNMRHAMVHRGKSPKVVKANAIECLHLVSTIGERVNDDVVRHYNREAS